ncbi:hypothetical protein RBSWK_06048 [Rhodopirellula baltica SWK14]|uniref:Uncharacterized protein n=1 Tax=Rhodopirellula baltica SWK14 TaxID=993516 RepID=L7C841_RHOBT|nr:hypothetical protein RBSWK_06048 [Rhodopirellula baltica SWK14]
MTGAWEPFGVRHVYHAQPGRTSKRFIWLYPIMPADLFSLPR